MLLVFKDFLAVTREEEETRPYQIPPLPFTADNWKTSGSRS